MNKKIIGLIALALFLIPTLTFATTFRAAEEVHINETVSDDIYVAGGAVRLTADVDGDVFIVGGQVSIDSVISQDLTITAGDITIRGRMNDDVRVGGGDITIDAFIKDDLIIGAGNIEFTSSSGVGGDVTLGGGNVVVNGPLNGDLIGGVGNLVINNEIRGNVKLLSVDKLQFGPKGRILGDLTYRHTTPFESITNETVAGNINYKAIEKVVSGEAVRGFGWAVIAGFSLYKFLSLLFVGLFFIWILRFFMTNTVQIAYKSPLKSLGIGILVLIVTPIVGALFLVSAIGIPISFLLFLLWLLILFVGKLIAIMMVGMKLVKVDDKSSFLRTYGAYALGTVIVMILVMIPVVGWILKFLLGLIGVGAIAMFELEACRFLRKKKLV